VHLLPGWQRVVDDLNCVFDTPPGLSGIIYGAEWSPTMEPGSWVPVNDAGTEPQHVFSVPIDGNEKKFLRLKVAVP
jgi:hypothetical protein